MTDPIIIIGAGIGGLSAAIRLAVAGKRVVVLEKNGQSGGKMGQFSAEGFRWDTGPSVITMRWVFEELFSLAGRKLEDYLTLLPLDPLTRYFYPDGSVLDVDPDPRRTASRLARYASEDGSGYLRFLDYTKNIHRATGDVFIYGPPPSVRTLLKANPLRMFSADPFRTMQQAIEGFVRSPQARQLLGRFATYTGASPFLAPATLNVIAHVELNEGVWYPQGGIYALAQTLTRLAEEVGVEIRLNCGVAEISVAQSGGAAKGGKLAVTGVVTEAGERLAATGVIANLDVINVYEKLLPPSPKVTALVKRLERVERSLSGFVMLLGVEGENAGLAHHNIFFSRDYAGEFREIFRQGRPPSEPTIYVAITSKSDPDHAPAGCENWFVLINTPPAGPGFDWPSQAEAYGKRVLDRLADEFGVDVRGRIRHQRILTPLDLERMTAARQGALYGTSSNDTFAAFRRPHNRSSLVQGLYFAGGTTHPGGGVPMVTLSGKVAAGMVLADWG
jgi:phytoene desaturase